MEEFAVQKFKLTGKSADIESNTCRMNLPDVERYLNWLQEKGRTASTLTKYRRSLNMLYDFLPDEKSVSREMLAEWRGSLLNGGYNETTVNAYIIAANNFLGFIDHRECQLTGSLEQTKNPRPELTRAEYLHLLSTAKTLEDETAYLLVKTFACTGIYVNELANVTVENVAAGHFISIYQNTKRTIRVPKCLQTELLNYASRNGIESGVIYRTRGGKPLQRSRVVERINRLGEDARIPVSRANPTALRKLFLTTRAGIMSGLEVLADQALDRQIEREDITVGWNV